jgi:hypothetical protein
VIFPTKVFALTGGPSQPEFASFDPAGSSEMVNLFTGDFGYNIPLMDVDGYPINIAYHAAPSMDQEASWVGLGWNVNAGAINRGMRGLPDDFNGDPINKKLNIEDYKAWGVSAGYFGELIGASTNFSFNAGLGVVHSNYSGFGIEISSAASFGVTAGGKTQGSLTAGLGVKLSSQDGMDLYPQLGIGAKMERTKRTTSVGVNVGCAINSRDGLKSVNGGFSISSQKTQGPSGAKEKTLTSNSGGKGTGIGVTSSASIPASSQGYMPKAVANMSSWAINVDFKIGPNSCVYAQGGYINGYYAKNGINDSQKDRTLNAYGYLFSQNGGDDALFDFSREKDGMVYPELPNMPIANFTYDLFSANAQGLNYAFRPHRSDIGILRDNATIDNSIGVGVGAEVMLSSDINVGVNVNVMVSNGKAGRWKDDNDFNIHSVFADEYLNDEKEVTYFKVAGEKNDDDIAFLSYFSNFSNDNDDAFRVNLKKKTNTTYYASNELVDKYGNNPTTSFSSPSATRKSKRITKNELVSYLNAFEASKFGIQKKIYDYPVLTTNSFSSAQFDNVVLNTTNVSGSNVVGEFVNSYLTSSEIDRVGAFTGERDHHMSEMSITQNNGSRYVYGIPMYNRKQTEAMFNIDKSFESTTNETVNDGLVSIMNQSEIGIGGENNNGIDHFMEKTIMNDFSHGFLLTSILSSDFVDRTGNGPSIDDYGDYTKFNYSKINTNKDDAYKWRIPVNNVKFVQGLLSDRKDNKGVYIYGEKDLWYTQSIETKNYVAFFVLNDDVRQDAFPVIDEFGVKATSNQSRYLKEIRLYSKKDFKNGIANAKPIKVVHFDYDYSLCSNTPNSAAGGKLTLKKIWFTYGNSEKGKSSPYQFDYADTNQDGILNSNDSNFPYNSAAVDRWGTYKPNTAGVDNNLDFPYVNQSDNDLHKNAAAWSLTKITTPAGSVIKVFYEADDYAFVQNKEAGQMFKVAGMNNAPTHASSDSYLYQSSTSREYLIVDLSKAGKGGGIVQNSGTSADIDNEFNTRYIKGLTKIYFRVKMDLDNKGNYEFVPGYADIEEAGVCQSDGTYQVNGTGPNYYRYGYLKLKLLGINDNNSGSPMVTGIVKAGMQMGRMYLPQIVFPGSAPASGNGNAIKGLVTTLKDAKYMLGGVNKALYDRDIAKSFDPYGSVVRLYNPNGQKSGGGHRVSKITINDGWNSMSGESDSEYGQEYAYTKAEGGKTISSGVASYEPLLGGDENSMRYPIDFSIEKTFSPNDEYFQEEPMGESFFPDPIVGYSKVTVKNISQANVNKHGTGRTEYEFFTARDFPVVTDRTDLQKQRVKPKLIQSILKFGSTDKLYLSQGYVIKTNDMHGKQKSQKMFAEGAGPNDAISGIIYHYKTRNGINSQELDNKADVIDKTNTIVNKTIGKTTDFYSDSRSSENDTYTGGIAININAATCTYYVPLVFVWPSFGYEHREFKSMGTTKLVQQYGLVDYVEAFENSSTVKTKNLLYDDISGEVLLSETTNNFDDPVYNFKYPAYWAYEDMGAAFANAGIKFHSQTIDGNGKIVNSQKHFFRPGDEVAVFDFSAGGTYTKTWVVENKQTGNNYYLVKEDGLNYSPSPLFVSTPSQGILKILRSGRRNMQSAPMASLLSLKNPVVSSGSSAPIISGQPLAGGKLLATAATSVINSSAVEFDENWHLLVGEKQQGIACACTQTQDFINLKLALYHLINNLHVNQTNYVYYLIYTLGPPYKTLDPEFLPLLTYHPFFNLTTCNGSGGNQTDNVYLTTNRPAPTFNSSLGLYEYKLIIDIIAQKNCPNGYGNYNHLCAYLPQLIIRTPSNLSNPWDDPLLHIENLTPEPIVGCQGATNAFSFQVSTGSSARQSEVSVINSINKNTGTGCYNSQYCTSSNVTTQCGKIVGDIINPYVENIRGNWRVKKSYSFLEDRTQTNQGAQNMNGNIRTDGVYNTFNPFWSYVSLNNKWLPITSTGNQGKWIKNNEVDKINEYGNVLTARDVLNRSSASLYGYNHTLPIAAANNATYNQLAFDGFEDYDYISNECSASLQGNVSSTNKSGYIEHFNYYAYKNQLSQTESHTGKYSINVLGNSSISVSRKLTNPSPTGGLDNVPYTIKEKDNYGMFGPYYGYAQQRFVLSVWAKENYNPHTTPSFVVLDYPHVGASISVNGANVLSSPVKKSAIINGWQKLEYEFTVPANSVSGNITVTLNNTLTYPVFYDDIRIHPFNSSMKSMVYDPYSLRLMAELDDRNYATFYEYDEEGTLVRVKKETEKGIYTIKESRSGLKK